MLSIGLTPSARAASISPGMYATTTAWLNLYAGPSPGYTALQEIPASALVYVNSGPYNSVWYHVTYGDMAGYAHGGYLVPGSAKFILVDISDQWLYAYQDGQLVFTAPVSTGMDGFNTPIGSFSIFWKYRVQTMRNYNYVVPNVPHVMYITYSGVALHGTYWHNEFGTGARLSHGCINLPLDAAAWLYNWAPLGTPVQVRP